MAEKFRNTATRTHTHTCVASCWSRYTRGRATTHWQAVCWDYLYANHIPQHGLSRLSTHGTTLRLRKITSHRFRESLCRCSSLFSRFEKFNFCTVIANRCTQMTLCVLHFNGKGYTVQKKVCALDAFCSFALGTCPLKRWCSWSEQIRGLKHIGEACIHCCKWSSEVARETSKEKSQKDVETIHATLSPENHSKFHVCRKE